MSSPQNLLNKVYPAWSKCLPSPYGSGAYAPGNNGKTTYCNDYVQEVSAGFGYIAFKGLLADDMVAHMKADTREWTSVSGIVAQQHADAGALVIAGYVNPSGHGHVSIVIPGIPAPSGKWNDPDCPVLANVGELIYCKIGLTANWAFDAEPVYFVLNDSLT